MAAFVLVPKPINENIYTELSDVGRRLYLPERDLPIFLVGCVLSLVLAFGISKTWEIRFRDKKASGSGGGIRKRTAWLLLLALGSTLTSFLVLTPERMRTVIGKPKTYQIALLVLPGCAALILGVVGIRPGRLSRWVADLLKRVTRATVNEPAPESPPYRLSGRFLDTAWGLMIAALILLLAYIPSYRELAGRVFESDSFHHWDFFVMGPALGYRAGAALGAERYSQYGVGYPMLVNWITPSGSLSYGKLIHLGNIYGCVYLLALAVGMRIVLRSRLWASLGMLLCLLLQYFHGVDAYQTIWTHPSSSILRYAMDVWFFLALVIHYRTGHRVAVLVAGALVGISLLLVLDSGAYLFVTFIGYLACRIILSRVSRGIGTITSREKLIMAAQALTTAAATFSIGLAFASRGLLFHRDFWPAYLEPIINYGNGMSSLPNCAWAGGEMAHCLLGDRFCLFILRRFAGGRTHPSLRRVDAGTGGLPGSLWPGNIAPVRHTFRLPEPLSRHHSLLRPDGRSSRRGEPTLRSRIQTASCCWGSRPLCPFRHPFVWVRDQPCCTPVS